MAIMKASGRVEAQLKQIGVEAWMQADSSLAGPSKHGKSKKTFQCGDMAWYLINNRKLLPMTGKDRRRLADAIKSRNDAAHRPEDEQPVANCIDAVATFEWFGAKIASLSSGRPEPTKAGPPPPAIVQPRPLTADQRAPVAALGAALPRPFPITPGQTSPTTRPTERPSVAIALSAASIPSPRQRGPSYRHIVVMAGLVVTGGVAIALGTGTRRPPPTHPPDPPRDSPTPYAPIGAPVPALLPDGVASRGREIGAVTLLRSTNNENFSVVFTAAGSGHDSSDVHVATFSNGTWSPRVSYERLAFVGDGAAIAPDGSIFIVMGDEETLVYANDRGGRWTRRPRPVPGMPPGNGTVSIDPGGTVHVTSNVALHTRYYTRLRGSQWDAPTVVSSSSTGPAAILAEDVLTLSHADWARRTLMRADGLDHPSAAVFNYIVDQGPPQSLASGTCGRVLAFSATRDLYVNYSLFAAHQLPGDDAWTAAVELRSSLPAISDVAVSCGPGTSAFVFACDASGTIHVSEIRNGRSVLSTVLAIPSCGGALDAVVVDTRAYLAYANAPRTELLVRSVDLTALR